MCPEVSIRILVISRAAHFEVLKIFDERHEQWHEEWHDEFLYQAHEGLTSAAPRPVLGLKPGSIALM